MSSRWQFILFVAEEEEDEESKPLTRQRGGGVWRERSEDRSNLASFFSETVSFFSILAFLLPPPRDSSSPPPYVTNLYFSPTFLRPLQRMWGGARQPTQGPREDRRKRGRETLPKYPSLSPCPGQGKVVEKGSADRPPAVGVGLRAPPPAPRR